MTVFSEHRRQLTHIGVGALALLLRWLTWWQAAAMAVVAVLFNLAVLPRIAGNVFRPGDLERPAFSGIVIYPVAVLTLVLAFPSRPDITAAAWGILAAGDGFATLVGAHVRTTPLPWNRAKTLGGLAAGFVAAATAGVTLAWWAAHGMDTPPPMAYLVAAPIAAAGAAAFVETIPIGLNDNISVPASAALVLWSLTFVDADVVAARSPVLASMVAPAALANAVVAFLGWRARTVTVAGAITGAVIGVAVWLGAGWQGWALLVGSFVLAALTTRAGHARKAALGIAEERGGRRGPGNAIANTGLFAWAAIVAVGMEAPASALLAGVAALAAAVSDTVASEAGKAFGRTTWAWAASGPWRAWRRVPAGTPGAVSLEGTVAGAAAAAAIAAAAAGLGLIAWPAVVVVTVVSVIASFVEGALSRAFEGPGILNNDTLNFLNSAAASALALLWWAS